jgi:uncharacterized protein
MSSNSSNPQVAEPQVAEAPKPPKRSFWYRFGMTFGVIGWAFAGFALAQAIGVVLVLGLQWSGAPLESINQSVFSTAINIVVYTLAVVIIIGVPKWVFKWKTTLGELGLSKRPKWMDLVWLLVSIFVYLILTVSVTALAMYLFPSADYEQAQNIGFEALTHHWEYTLAFVSLVVVAPIAEELIFRGYLFGKLKKYAAVWISILLSAALFAVAHGQWNVALDTFALGIVLATLRVVTGSLWASIVLHALKNGLAFYFLFVNPIIL